MLQLQGKFPGKPNSYQEMFQSLQMGGRPKHRLLLTAQRFGFFTDGSLLSQLSRSERLDVQSRHLDAKAGDEEYVKATPFNVEDVLPKYVGPLVCYAKYAGGTEKNKVVGLEGEGRKVYVELGCFLTIHHRHPEADWWFAYGVDYDERPVVLLEPNGKFTKGSLLGALAPVHLKTKGSDLPTPEKFRKRTKVKGGWLYVPVKLKIKAK